MNNMMDLKNIQWAEFMFIDIFEIKNGFYNKKPIPSVDGKIPFIGATQNNNGITEFYTFDDIESNSKIGYGKNEEISKKIFNGNAIAVTNNGSVGFAYYQKHDFTCSHDVNPLYLKNYELNEYIAKFLISAIEMQRVCFEYARKWRPKRMVKSKILLPVNSNGEPNYPLMEQYIKQKEQSKFGKIEKHISKKIEQVNIFKKVEPLNEKEWSEFNVIDLFDFVKGDQNNMANIEKGIIPLVSAKKGDNGYKDFAFQKDKKIFKKNSLTLNNDGDGGAGISFYQPFDYLLDSHVTALYSKNDLNKYVLLFISRCVTAQREKFGHGYSINNQRLRVFKFMLPVDKNSKPDYDYMENYIKKLEYEKLTKYIERKKTNAQHAV
jgi:hypothetical protein